MNADDNEKPRSGNGQTGSGTSDPRLAELSRKLDAEKKRREVQQGGLTSEASSGMGRAIKLSSEFVAGTVVGFVIGYTIDQFAGTSPWGLIVFLLIGFAAGTLNVLRAVGVVSERFPPDDKSRKP